MLSFDLSGAVQQVVGWRGYTWDSTFEVRSGGTEREARSTYTIGRSWRERRKEGERAIKGKERERKGVRVKRKEGRCLREDNRGQV